MQRVAGRRDRLFDEFLVDERLTVVTLFGRFDEVDGRSAASALQMPGVVERAMAAAEARRGADRLLHEAMRAFDRRPEIHALGDAGRDRRG